jgi:hypothetical protein
MTEQPQQPSDGDNDTKDNSKVQCFKYKELGYYVRKDTTKANTQGSMKKDLSTITCYKCERKEHHTRRRHHKV